MPGLSDIPGNHTARVVVPAEGTAGNADTWPVFVAPGKITVTGVRWTPSANVTGANTNNFAFAVQNRGQAGSGTTAVTSTKTYASGTNGVANQAEALTLSGTAANLNAVANDVLSLVRSVNGSGLASPAGLVEIDFRYAGI